MDRLLILALMPVFFAASAAACPDPSARDEVDALNSGDLYTANTYPVLAGGGQDLSNCLDRQGYVALRPDFSFRIEELENFSALEVTAHSEGCDVIVLVNTAEGRWYYDHNYLGPGGGSQVNIGDPASGLYDIWVGTFDIGLCFADLEIETFISYSENGAIR